jgi:hypothetical protein
MSEEYSLALTNLECVSKPCRRGGVASQVRTVFGKYCPISGVLASVRAPQAAVLKCALNNRMGHEKGLEEQVARPSMARAELKNKAKAQLQALKAQTIATEAQEVYRYFINEAYGRTKGNH